LTGTNVFISSAYAQAAAGGDTQSTLVGMLPLVLMFVVLYFVMIRPQMKRQKEHKAMVEALAKGDEIATAGGLLKCKCNVLPWCRCCPKAPSSKPLGNWGHPQR
jgi:Preprotein translocase subunit